MAGIAFVGLRLIATLIIVQSISIFTWHSWPSKIIGLGMIAVSITLWRYAELVAMKLTKKDEVEPWAERWSVWLVSMYGVYILIWQIPILISRNSFGVWLTVSHMDDEPYWFVGNPYFIGTSIAAVLFLIGPDKVWRTLVVKMKSSN